MIKWQIGCFDVLKTMYTTSITCAEAAACVGRLLVVVVSTRRRGCLRSLINGHNVPILVISVVLRIQLTLAVIFVT